jgi:hypothetical protein
MATERARGLNSPSCVLQSRREPLGEDDMDRISKELARFRHELDEHFAGVAVEFRAVRDRMDAAEKRMDGIHHSMDAFFGRLEDVFQEDLQWRQSMESRMEALEKRQPPAA